MKKICIFGGAVIAISVAIWLLVFNTTPQQQISNPPSTTAETATTTRPETFECNGDAKICPDGSSVGRTGPSCEFAACPPPDATSARVETYLGGRAGGLNLTINPIEVVSDSRCPTDVQCVWAGTVEVRATVATQVGHGEHIFKLGEPRTVGDLTVTLTEVRPSPKAQTPIPESSYRFVFEEKK